MKEKSAGFFCEECHLVISTGDKSKLDLYYADPEKVAETIWNTVEEIQKETGGILISNYKPDIEIDDPTAYCGHFTCSTEPCMCCGTTRFGDRYEMCVLIVKDNCDD